MLNAELVRQGYAQVTTFPPHVKYQELFLTLPREAREAKRGLWGNRRDRDHLIARLRSLTPRQWAPRMAAHQCLAPRR
jgi:endonuclease YncB( thermonuclease family)